MRNPVGRKRPCAPHGDLPKWRAALAALPETEPRADCDRPAPRLGTPVPDVGATGDGLAKLLMALHPWRKGPLELGGVYIDSEWRSDWKWERVAPHVDLAGRRVLDVGCGNGYFGWRMLGAGAELVVGIDPTQVYVMQWLACRHFAGDVPNFVLPLGIEDLPGGGPEWSGSGPRGFDAVFSMGVLYHRRDPLEHLRRLRERACRGGTLVLETLVLPPDCAGDLLVPGERYARMRNVWSIPGTERLTSWVGAAGFDDIRVVDVTPTTVHEQRSTAWMTFESLAESLAVDAGADDAEDSAEMWAERTVEGHPAPVRAVLVARA